MTDSRSAPNEHETPEPAPRPTSGPAPRWGEYAPVPAGPAPDAVAPVSAVAGRVGPRGDSADGRSASVGPAAGERTRTPRMWDRVITIVLLVLATYTVITGLFSYSNLPGTLDQVFALQGIGRFEAGELARTIGLVLNVLHLSVYAVTVWLSYRMLKQNRITFWVPLTAGVVVSLITAVLLVVLVIGDPGFQSYVRSSM